MKKSGEENLFGFLKLMDLDQEAMASVEGGRSTRATGAIDRSKSPFWKTLEVASK